MILFSFHNKDSFSQASVILFTRGVSTRHPPGQTTPWADTPGQTPPWANTPWVDTLTPLARHPHPFLGRHPPTTDGYCSGRYASYWNAFLLTMLVVRENLCSSSCSWTFYEDRTPCICEGSRVFRKLPYLTRHASLLSLTISRFSRTYKIDI